MIDFCMILRNVAVLLSQADHSWMRISPMALTMKSMRTFHPSVRIPKWPMVTESGTLHQTKRIRLYLDLNL